MNQQHMNQNEHERVAIMIWDTHPKIKIEITKWFRRLTGAMFGTPFPLRECIKILRKNNPVVFDVPKTTAEKPAVETLFQEAIQDFKNVVFIIEYKGVVDIVEHKGFVDLVSYKKSGIY